MAKVLKIVKKRRGDEDEKPAVKTAKGGSAKTGAKVEKVGKSKASSEGAVGRLIGVTSGLGIAKFQNKTILDNLKAKLTDEQLAAKWRKEFPQARAEYTADTVRSVRNLVNRGAHGNDEPKHPIPQFDEDGDALPFHGEKAAAKRQAKEEAEAEERRAKKVKKAKG